MLFQCWANVEDCGSTVNILKAVQFLCIRQCQCLLQVKPLPPSFFFWRRMPIDVRIKATYDSYRPNSFLVCLNIQLV